MEGCGTKVSGELPGYKYGAATPAFGGGAGGANTPTTVNTPGYGVQESQVEGGQGVGAALGGSAVEELGESGGGGSSGGGRKKKKKHKSGEESAKSSAVVADDELVDAVLPMLSDNQDVEDMMFPSTLPASGGTLVGGQYLNNSLLDQILTEKKMQILQSPDVMEFLRKQMAKK